MEKQVEEVKVLIAKAAAENHPASAQTFAQAALSAATAIVALLQVQVNEKHGTVQ